MKRLLFALLLATLTSCCAAPGLASAHVLKIDGDISAILHINPDDYATSGHPTSYTLWFDDSTGHFTLPACNCTATVRENSQTLSTAPLSITHSLESDNTATFPKPDVYTL
ncbi:MAG TPA: hypothetical protein VHA37_08905, partial [Candidatus Saccharimonadales bacterium]|nr:hypothetical protein [Candidatus Saccharimonadales bacterium]